MNAWATERVRSTDITVSCQRKAKQKYGFEDSISNVDLSLAAKQPINV